MTLSLWKNSSGSIIVDSSGHPILCDHCPCGKIIPAGTIVKYSMLRVCTRAYDVTTGSRVPDGSPSVFTYSTRKRINYYMTMAVEGEFEMQTDIPISNSGTWVPIVDTDWGEYTSSVAFDVNAYGQIDDVETVPPRTTTTVFTPSDSGMNIWYGAEKAKMDYSQSSWRWIDYSGYPGSEFSLPMLTWLKDGQAAYFNDSLLERTGYWAQGAFSETITGGTKQEYGITETVRITHVNENNGYAEVVFDRTAGGSYEVDEGYAISYGSGSDAAAETWRAEWELIPPNVPCPSCSR